MTSAVLVHLITYAAVIAFVGVVAYKFLKLYNMPMHLRWEIYPVAHESGDKAKYGGSKLEGVNWWEKEHKSSFVNELKYMIPEMTLLAALFEHNRKMWWRSFPFHFGLYILAGAVGLIILGAILELFGVYVGGSLEQASIVGSLVYYSTMAAMLVGLVLCTVGAAGLLHRRFFDADLRDYTSAGHIFNLLFFLAVLVVAWLTFIFVDSNLALTRSYVQSLLTFNLAAPVGHPLLAAEIVLAVLLIAYIPMTHMSHFFIKWFTYHKIRWDDEPNIKGSALEQKILEQVHYPVTWAAPHLKADGKKNWVDIATEEME